MENPIVEKYIHFNKNNSDFEFPKRNPSAKNTIVRTIRIRLNNGMNI